MNIVLIIILYVCGDLKFVRLETPPNVSEDCACGLENVQHKVVGGAELSIPNKYPWLVSLAFNNGTHFCGAAIINNKYLLTAAHCFEYIKEPDFLASFGAHNVTLFENRFRVEHIISHENYTRSDIGLFYDIALLKMKDIITFSRTVQPICLPKKTMTEFDNLIIAGWGYISPFGPTSDVAKELSLPPVTNEECFNFHGDIITPYQLCAGGVSGEDSCSGDSGGPLMSRISSSVYQAGVVSYGIGCARPGYYGVYSRVSKFSDWIYDHTQDATYCLPRSVGSTTPSPSETTPSKSATTITTPPSSRPISPPIGKNQMDCGIEGKNGVRYPWIAAVYYNDIYFGTAVLVTKRLLITTGTNLRLLKVMNRLDTQNLRVVFAEFGQTKAIESVDFHSKFGRRNVYDNNFALITIEDTSIGNEKIKPRPICLPQASTKLYDDTILKTLTWNIEDSNNNEMSVIEGNIEIVNRIRCSKTRRWITGSMICGTFSSSSALYFGNPGAPAMIKIDDRWYLGALLLTIHRSSDIPLVFSDARYSLGFVYNAMK